MNIVRYEAADLSVLQAIGEAANEAASRHVFDAYRGTKAANTLKSQKRSVGVWASFLGHVGVLIDPETLWDNPAAWNGVTWGLVEAFKKWGLNEGHALSTINARVKCIKKYCELAHKGGVIGESEAIKIATIKTYSKPKERANLDAKRAITRTGRKKKSANVLTEGQVTALLGTFDDSDVGKRDRLLACLLFEHGLRISEIMLLDERSFYFGMMRFDRPKVGLKDCEHQLTPRTKKALMTYAQSTTEGRQALGPSPFWQSANRGGLSGRKMSESSLKRAVKKWGKRIGIGNLSPHDARHTLATKLARGGYSAVKLLDFFGWASLSTAQNYIERSKIGNEGIDSSW